MEQDVADAIDALRTAVAQNKADNGAILKALDDAARKLDMLDTRTLPLVDFGLTNDVNQVKQSLLDLGDRVKALEARKP